jgi:hypothetical protein
VPSLCGSSLGCNAGHFEVCSSLQVSWSDIQANAWHPKFGALWVWHTWQRGLRRTGSGLSRLGTADRNRMIAWSHERAFTRLVRRHGQQAHRVLEVGICAAQFYSSQAARTCTCICICNRPGLASANLGLETTTKVCSSLQLVTSSMAGSTR